MKSLTPGLAIAKSKAVARNSNAVAQNTTTTTTWNRNKNKGLDYRKLRPINHWAKRWQEAIHWEWAMAKCQTAGQKTIRPE
ncbi:hypothetical protein INR49_003017, partial [Caranx melampygus]